MARGDERQSRVGASRDSSRDIESLSVHRHGDQPCTGRTEEAVRPWIPWIFHPDRGPRFKEDASREVEALLRAADENHLIGRAEEPPSVSQIACDDLSQRPVSQRMLATREGRGQGPPSPGQQSSPKLPRKDVQRWDARSERPKRGVVRRRRSSPPQPPQDAAPSRWCAARAARWQAQVRAEKAVRKAVRDTRSRSHLSADIALDQELIVRKEHGVA